jgi:hypothetical protein
MNRNCTRCKSLLADGDQFCGVCGQRQEQAPRLNFSQAPPAVRQNGAPAQNNIPQDRPIQAVQAGRSMDVVSIASVEAPNRVPPPHAPVSVAPPSPATYLNGYVAAPYSTAPAQPQLGPINCLICSMRPALSDGDHCAVCAEKLNRKPEQWDAVRAAAPPPLTQELGGLSARTKGLVGGVVGICIIAVMAALGHGGGQNGSKYASSPNYSGGTATPAVSFAPQPRATGYTTVQAITMAPKGYWRYRDTSLALEHIAPLADIFNTSDQNWTNVVVTVNKGSNSYSGAIAQISPNGLGEIELSDLASASGQRFNTNVTKILSVNILADTQDGHIEGALPLGAETVAPSFVTTPDYKAPDPMSHAGDDNITTMSHDAPSPYQTNPDGSIKTD